MLPQRLILAHKHSTSAWLRFLCFEHGVCAFDPLPAFSVLDETTPAPSVVLHPAVYLRAAQKTLGLEDGSLRHEPAFSAYVTSPVGRIEVQLATFTGIDPPFLVAQAAGGRFISITQARDFSVTEQGLLRIAYSVLI